MSKFIRQNEVNMANEPLKVQQTPLESSSELDEIRCITNTAHSLGTKITVMGTIFFSRFLSEGEFPKMLVEKFQKRSVLVR